MKKMPLVRQKFAFSVLFVMGANLLFGCSYRAEQDTWISMLIAVVFLCMWVLVLARISILFPDKDIFALLKLLPGWACFPLTVIVSVYCFGQATMTLRAYAGFVHIVSLPKTGVLVFLALTSGIVFLFLSRKNVVLFRFSYMAALPIVLIVFLLFVLLVGMFRPSNLFPIFYDNTQDVLLCSLQNLSHPLGNIFLLSGIAFYPENAKKNMKTWLGVVGVSGGLSLIIVFQNLLLLGGKLANSLDFPYNFSASLVNLADFFSRIEVFASLFFFLSGIVRSSYFMKLASRGISSCFPVSQRVIALPLSVLLCGYSAIAFDNTNSILNYLEVFPFVAIPLQFGLPLLLWVIAEIHHKKDNGSKTERKVPEFQMML